MFKVFVISALFMVFACEATDLACKVDTTTAVGGVCPDGTTLIGETCCNADEVFDVDAYACKSEPMPAIERSCPYGFILVAEGCCPNSDAYAKEK